VGYSPSACNARATVKAFESASHQGVCDGAILRAAAQRRATGGPHRAVSWGYRNGTPRFAPLNHALLGAMLVVRTVPTSGGRDVEHAPDSLHAGPQNPDAPRTTTAGPTSTASCRRARRCSIPSAGRATISASRTPRIRRAVHAGESRLIEKENVPIRMSSRFPPQPITSRWPSRPAVLRSPESSSCRTRSSPVLFGLEPRSTRSRATSASGGECHLPARRWGTRSSSSTSGAPGQPFALKTMRFAHNTTFEQAFVDGLRGFNRPTNVRDGT